MNGMRRLNTLWQMVNALSTVRDIAQQSRTYQFAVPGPITFYFKAQDVEVFVNRWNRPHIELTVRLQAAFGWQVAAEQDEAGVYVVARRRAVVGGMARASFQVMVPPLVYVMLNLENGRIILDNVTGTFQLPPEGDGNQLVNRPVNE